MNQSPIQHLLTLEIVDKSTYMAVLHYIVAQVLPLLNPVADFSRIPKPFILNRILLLCLLIWKKFPTEKLLSRDQKSWLIPIRTHRLFGLQRLLFPRFIQERTTFSLSLSITAGLYSPCMLLILFCSTVYELQQMQCAAHHINTSFIF